MNGFNSVQRGDYVRGDQIERTEVEVRVEKLTNGKVADKCEVTGEKVKGSDMVWTRYGVCAI